MKIKLEAYPEKIRQHVEQLVIGVTLQDRLNIIYLSLLVTMEKDILKDKWTDYLKSFTKDILDDLANK